MQSFVYAALVLVGTALRAQDSPIGPQFEVATIKPAANDGAQDPRSSAIREAKRNVRNMQAAGTIPMASPNRVRFQGWPLLELIAAAYGVRDAWVSGPVWLASQSFDIEAKIPEGTPKQELNAMLQSLLEERFGLKVHRGTQTGPGFALVVGKSGPMLKPAEPPPAPTQGLTKEEHRKLKSSRGFSRP